MRYSEIKECTVCKTKLRVQEEGTRFPWIDNESYYCPVCGKLGGEMKTHYNLSESVVSLRETIEPYKTEYLNI